MKTWISVIILITFLSSCSEIRTGIKLDKKVNVNKISKIEPNENKTFSILENKNINLSLEYQYIGDLLVNYLTKIGYVKDDRNPKYVISYMYGSAKSYQYSIDNGKIKSYSETYSNTTTNSSEFLFSLDIYDTANKKIFEGYSLINFDKDDPKKNDTKNILIYMDCLIKSILYDNDNNNYNNPFVTQSFMILCNI